MSELSQDIGDTIQYWIKHPGRILPLLAVLAAGCAANVEAVQPVARITGDYCPQSAPCANPDKVTLDVYPKDKDRDLSCPSTTLHFTGLKNVGTPNSPIFMSTYDTWNLVPGSCKRTSLATPTPIPTPTSTVVAK